MPDEAVNPAGGTAPEPKPITDEASAVAAVASLLEPEPVNQRKRRQPQEDNRDGDEPETDLNAEPEDDPEDEPVGDPEDDPAGEPDSDEPADDTGEGALELPPTIAAFAEALGVEPEALLNVKAPVNIDGKVSEVTLSEAIAGYSKDQDYRRKTESLANERKQFTAHAQQAQAAFQQKMQMADAMISALQGELAAGPTEAELAQLLTENPSEYIRQKEQIEQRHKRLAQFQHARAQQLQQENGERLAQIAAFRKSQQDALRQHFPELADPQKGNEIQGRVMKVLSEFDFGEEELRQYMAGPFDSRLIRIALKLDELTQMQSKGKAAVKKIALKPTISKPGVSSGKKGAAEKQQELRNKLRRHGKDRSGTNRVRAENDAVAYVRNLLE